MRKKVTYIIATIVLLLLLGVGEMYAQHYIGIRGGAGSGSARFEPKRSGQEMASVWGLPSFGVSWKYYSRERVLGGVEIDLMFMRVGYKRLYQRLEDPSDEESPMETYRTYQRTIDRIILPIAWQPHGYLFKRRMRVFLNLAVTFSYNFASRQKEEDFDSDESSEGKYKMKTTRDNPFGYGLFGGGGISWMFGKWELVGEARYYFGLGDVLRNPNKYKEKENGVYVNPQRSPVDAFQFQFGLYYRLGKTGILSPAGKKNWRNPNEQLPTEVVKNNKKKQAE